MFKRLLFGGALTLLVTTHHWFDTAVWQPVKEFMAPSEPRLIIGVDGQADGSWIVRVARDEWGSSNPFSYDANLEYAPRVCQGPDEAQGYIDGIREHRKVVAVRWASPPRNRVVRTVETETRVEQR